MVQNITNSIKHELMGLSTDIATLGDYNAGSTFFAIDTGAIYICDGDNWIEV